jgi:hypothetical protein
MSGNLTSRQRNQRRHRRDRLLNKEQKSVPLPSFLKVGAGHGMITGTICTVPTLTTQP